MPFDPFFSSANKKHYIENPEFTALIEKVRAMTPENRQAWIAEMYYKAPNQKTLIEKQVLKALRFEYNIGARCRRRWVAERFACDLQAATVKHGVSVLHGASNTGANRGDTQKRGSKSTHFIQGGGKHFDRIYDKKR